MTLIKSHVTPLLHCVLDNFRDHSSLLGSFAFNLCCLFLPTEHFAADAMFALMQADIVQSEQELINPIPFSLALLFVCFFFLIHPR